MNSLPGCVLAIVLAAFPAASHGQAPRIESIDPGEGPIAGGTVVTVKGVNLAGVNLVLDSSAVTPQSSTATEVRFTTPAHDNGIVTIKLTNSVGTAYGEFLYVPPRLQDLPPGYITTIAGVGGFKGYYRQATKADINRMSGVTFDQNGNLYIAEPGENRVSRVNVAGVLEPFAGNGIERDRDSYTGEGGPAVDARLSFPREAAADSNGNVYIGELRHRVRRVDTRTGIITTIAGDGTAGFSGDGGPARFAKLNNVAHITGDGRGTICFIDYDDVSNIARIRKITPDGFISTIGGDGPPGFSGDGGPATQARFNILAGDDGSLALDRLGNVYVADTGNHRIRRIDGRTGIITTIAGPTGESGATLNGLRAVAVDPEGFVYYAHHSGGNRPPKIVKMTDTGHTVASYGKGIGFSEDGTSVEDLNVPSLVTSITIDPAGNVVYSDAIFSRVRRLNLTTGKLETVAGCGPNPVNANGPALAAVLRVGYGDLALLPTGELLIGDTGDFLVRKIDRAGNIATIAGPSDDIGSHFEDRTAIGAYISPVATKSDTQGRIYVADTGPIIWRIDLDGMLRRVAGGGYWGEAGFSGDGGPALEAQLCQPWDVAWDTAGNLFIADTNNNRIRRVDTQTGIITTVAGSGRTNGSEHYNEGSFGGDGGPATQALLNTPTGVAVGPDGNLYIADLGNGRIRRVDANGVITTFAHAEHPYSSKLVFDRLGNLYVAYTSGIVRIDRQGVVTSLAGGNWPGFSGDGGPALGAKIQVNSWTVGITIDAEGNLFFIDGGNNRVRAIRHGALLHAPAIALPPVNARVTAGQPAVFAVAATGYPAPSYQWRKNGSDIAGATEASYTVPSSQAADQTAEYTVCVSNVLGSTTSSPVGFTITSDPTAPVIAGSTLPQALAPGASSTLTVWANGLAPLSYRWLRNGNECADGTSSRLTITSLQPANTGLYSADVTNAIGSVATDPIIVGISTTDKVTGAGRELLPINIRHPNGNTFDQVLMTGPAEAITADYALNQITRTSFIDVNDDIVQVEFSGPGTLSLVLAGASGPAQPVNYNQATEYVKGHAGIVITGATEDTNVSVFTVGRATAFDPTGAFNMTKPISATNLPANNGNPLFQGHGSTAYDGVADLAFIAIASSNGRFGGVRAANASFFADKGYTGIYAPGVEFTGPVFVGNLSAFGAAEPIVLLGEAGDVRVTGGDMHQENTKPVQVSGFAQLKFTAGSDSHGNALPAQRNRAVLMQNGVDVTAQVVVNPTP